MNQIEEICQAAMDQGFTHAAALDCKTIQLLPEVRQMCASNSCHMYGKRWSCPPYCGTIEECRANVARYERGILVQTVGELEDELDGETMLETEARHKETFQKLEKILRKRFPKMLAMGAGCCTKCKVCTCPEEPCRFPGESFSSMEAYGMLVTQICQANDVKYYYGPCTIAYTSCYLLE
jgi:predicted metal-binding protein